ncbi:SPCS3 [Branchiostoma lanceolatum]|uniref:Signal peptidase complex subunit 3 n=1 Tax=Branchiostoma lanceolatum TaxID=7740 RepID=A0A8K0ESD1_BRALA|nr:SPCS3 [Branchiostoma lanceolatum]
MNTVLSRANTIFAFTLSVMAALTFCCFLTTAMNDHLSPIKIDVNKIIVKNVQDFSTTRDKNDLGFITFDLQADLQHLFNWNMKQLFLYLTAEYTTPNNKLNQVVLWDKIIRRGENARLDYRSLHSKYYFFDDGKGLRGNQNVTLTLSWNVIPNAGTLPRISGVGSKIFQFPEEYTPGNARI